MALEAPMEYDEKIQNYKYGASDITSDDIFEWQETSHARR